MARKDREQTPYAFKTAALAKEGLIYGAANGLLVSVHALNASAGVRYLQLHDSVTDPGGAAVPAVSLPVAAGALVSASYRPGLDLFTATGCYWTCSTAAAVNTKSASNDMLVWGQYYKATT